jgi:hypothetical protein
MRNENNIKVVVRDRNNRGGYDVFLDFSGSLEYLMSFKYSYALHSVLMRKEWTVGEIRRMKPHKEWNYRWGGKDKARKLDSSVKHLLDVIDWYLEDRRGDLAEIA